MSKSRLTAIARNILLNYSTSHLSKTDRVRFLYALKGRDGKSGILRATRTLFLAKSVLLAPEKHAREVQDFLKFWKCQYKRKALRLGAQRPTHTIFVYKTTRLSKSDLVRFYYALKGRDGHSGILKATKASALAKSVVVSPSASTRDLAQFFAFWKIPVKRMEVAIDNE